MMQGSNQALLPTPMLVTPRAGARVAPHSKGVTEGLRVGDPAHGKPALYRCCSSGVSARIDRKEMKS